MTLRLVRLGRSSRRGKKLMAEFSDGTTTHFGAAGYGDFTVYWSADPALAEKKRRQYIARHAATERWDDPRTPATLARYILWEKPTVGAAVLAYRRRFEV